MTTTPQAALLSEADMLDCLREATHEIPTRIPQGWRKVMQAAEKRIIAKLQATQEPVQAGELPPLPVPTKAGHLVSSCPVYQDLEVKRIQKAAFDAGAALSARKPLTYDLICNAIDLADTESMKADYMLDSNDCIAVVRTMQALIEINGIGLEVKHG